MFTFVRYKSETVVIDVKSIVVLNMLFAIEKRISVSALSRKMNRRLVWQKAMRIKQDLLTYNASINLRTECSEREKSCGVNQNKSAISNCFIICAANFIRIAIDAGNFDAPLLHCLHRIPYCQSNRLFILLERERKRKYDFYSKAACSNCK